MTVAPATSRSDFQTLPPNLEQLVIGCFDVGEYEAGLDLLSQIISSNMIPSQHLFEHVIVICASRYRPQYTRPFGKKRRRGPSRELEDVSLSAVKAAYALLQRYSEAMPFASVLLSALPSSSRSITRDAASSRRSLSRRGSDASSQADTSPLAASVGFFISSSDHVWDMLRKMNAQTHSGEKKAWSWIITQAPPMRSTQSGQRKFASKGRSREVTAAASSASIFDFIEESLEHERAGRVGDSEQVEALTESLTAMQQLQSQRCWRLLDLLVRCWSTQGAGKMPMLEPSKARSQINLLDQIAPLRNRINLPLREANDLLDTIFAGLCDSSAWATQPPTRRKSHHDMNTDDRIDTAVRLWTETTHLVSSGLIDEGTLVRGAAQRLLFVSRATIRIINAKLKGLEPGSVASVLMSKAYLRSLRVSLKSIHQKNVAEPGDADILASERHTLADLREHFGFQGNTVAATRLEQNRCIQAFRSASRATAVSRAFAMVMFATSTLKTIDDAAAMERKTMLSSFTSMLDSFDLSFKDSKAMKEPSSSSSALSEASEDEDVAMTTSGDYSERSSSPIRKSSRTTKVTAKMGISKRTRKPGLPKNSTYGDVLVVEDTDASESHGRRKKEAVSVDSATEVPFVLIEAEDGNISVSSVLAWLNQQTLASIKEVRDGIEAWAFVSDLD